MDGNGRWAESRGLHRSEGHAEGARAVREAVRTSRWEESRALPRREGQAEGARAVREAVRTSREVGVRYLTLYAFSVANWSRPRPEVEALMRLLQDFAESERKELREKGIRLNVI